MVLGLRRFGRFGRSLQCGQRLRRVQCRACQIRLGHLRPQRGQLGFHLLHLRLLGGSTAAQRTGFGHRLGLLGFQRSQDLLQFLDPQVLHHAITTDAGNRDTQRQQNDAQRTLQGVAVGCAHAVGPFRLAMTEGGTA